MSKEDEVLKDLIEEKPAEKKAEPQKPAAAKPVKKTTASVKKAKWYKLDTETEARPIAPGIVACRFNGGQPFVLDGRFKIDTIDGVYFRVVPVIGK